MGKNVTVDGEIVCDPALRVAQLFQAQVAALVEVTGVPSGVDEPVDDMIEIDLPIFDAFVRHPLDMLVRTRHPISQLLLSGTVETCVAVHYAATQTRIDASPHVEALVDRATRRVHRPS